MSEQAKSTTEAPTSGVTEQALQAKLALPELDADEVAFVTLMCQYYQVHGETMSLDTALGDYEFELEEFTSLITDERIQAAIQERGVRLKPETYAKLTSGLGDSKSSGVGGLKDTVSWQDKTLTPLQLIVANTMLDLVDTRSQKKKLQDLGVGTTLYNTWLKDPVFSQYLRERAEAMLGENQHEAHLALLDKVRMGDMKAIAYYNEMTGRYVQQTSTAQGSNVQLDFKNLLVNILEIINDEIDDPLVGMRIAERFRTLTSINNTANALIEGAANQSPPEVVPNRELSPKLQAIMEGSTNGSEDG